jgi:Rod binding domain-containing protein
MIGALTPASSLPNPPNAGTLRDRQRMFQDVLGRAAPRPTGADPARDAAEKFVALAFVQPLLKDMRNASWGAAPFAPSPAEKSFRALSDAQLAQDLVRAGRWPIVERLARDLRGRTGPDPIRKGIDA